MEKQMAKIPMRKKKKKVKNNAKQTDPAQTAAVASYSQFGK